jgi:hypothetical protein
MMGAVTTGVLMMGAVTTGVLMMGDVLRTDVETVGTTAGANTVGAVARTETFAGEVPIIVAMTGGLTSVVATDDVATDAKLVGCSTDAGAATAVDLDDERVGESCVTGTAELREALEVLIGSETTIEAKSDGGTDDTNKGGAAFTVPTKLT